MAKLSKSLVGGSGDDDDECSAGESWAGVSLWLFLIIYIQERLELAKRNWRYKLCYTCNFPNQTAALKDPGC